MRCLVAIVDESTFTDAAVALGVSRTLASLEHALGVRLLRRNSREVTPTATGLRVVAHARRLLEGACEPAVVRRPLDDRRFDSAIVGLERRLCAMASDDPPARRRSVRPADLTGRTLLVDRRTGTTTTDLWPPDSRPATEETHDADDWLTVIATGRCVGLTAESTANQYPRPGVVHRPVRDGEPIAVRLAWWKDDPHPATQAVLELLTTLYREG